MIDDEENLSPEMVPAPLLVRYPAEAAMLQRALAGDDLSIEDLFLYLATANPDLRRIIQATFHDVNDRYAWSGLLACLSALPDKAGWLADTLVVDEIALAEGFRHILLGRAHIHNLDFERLEQTMVSVLALDDYESERLLKTQIFKEILVDATTSRRQAYSAAYLLGLRGELAVIPYLEEMIDTQSTGWGVWAVNALAVLDDPRCAAPLVRALAKDRDMLHIAAQHALNELGRNAEEALAAALFHPDAHIRWHAARTLGQIGDPRAVDALAEGLRDSKQAVRWTSARVLAALEAPAIPAILRVLASHPVDEPLRRAAYHALHAMPTAQCQAYLAPLLSLLRSPGSGLTSSAMAKQMLADWKPCI
jgi:hypothetical protein